MIVTQVYSQSRNRPALTISSNIECPTAQCRIMPHQPKPETFGLWWLVRESDSIVGDREAKLRVIRCQPNINVLCRTMFNRVCYRLLGDSVKLICNSRIVDPN